MRPATEQVTQRVDAVGGGGSQAAEKLLPIVYEELRQMAASKMAKEAPGHTLQPTALVHEAWLRLVGVKGRECWDRAHSLAAAGEARQRMLVENARCQRRAMPHRGQVRLDINQVQVGVASDDETVLAVSEVTIAQWPARELRKRKKIIASRGPVFLDSDKKLNVGHKIRLRRLLIPFHGPL